MIHSPCKKCTKRTTGHSTVSCHSRCKEYKAFRQEVDAANLKKEAERDYNNYMEDNHVHVQRAKG